MVPAADGGLPRGVSPAANPPCPPSGTHHYRFTLYALAAPLGLPGHPAGATVRAALARASILGQTTLVGTYRA